MSYCTDGLQQIAKFFNKTLQGEGGEEKPLPPEKQKESADWEQFIAGVNSYTSREYG